MSICNPVGYDRPESLYVHKPSQALYPLFIPFRVISPRLYTTFGGVKSLSGGDATAIRDTRHTIPKYMYFAIHTEISSTSMYSMSGQ